MKLYFRGEENGNLSYTTDGVRFTSTTLEALRNGVTLPDNTDYTKVQVKAGSNVFSALDVVKKVELVGGTDVDVERVRNYLNPYLIANEKTSQDHSAIDNLIYSAGCDYYSDPFSVIFKNNSDGSFATQLDGASDDASYWNYALVLCIYGRTNEYIELADLGPIEEFFEK